MRPARILSYSVCPRLALSLQERQRAIRVNCSGISAQVSGPSMIVTCPIVFG